MWPWSRTFCLMLCSYSTIWAQNAAPEKFVLTPREQALAVVAQQPESPLQLTRVREITTLDGRLSPDFLAHNRGSKAIRSYTVAAWTSEATGTEWTFTARAANEWIAPGQTHSLAQQEGQLVPLTAELRDRLRLQGPMRGVRIYMVVRVELIDGTVFSDEAAFNALQEYFERLSCN